MLSSQTYRSSCFMERGAYRDHQLHSYVVSLLFFILHGCHCTGKWRTNICQFSLCFFSYKIIQKAVLCSHLRYWIEIVKYTLGQQVLMCSTNVRSESYKLYEGKFHHKYPCVWVPTLSNIFELVNKDLLGKTSTKQCCAEENVDKIGTTEHLP
jgi:hypothetical protein